jgi:hypothetical protein
MIQDFPSLVQLMQIHFGFAASRAVEVTTERCIADFVKNEAKSADELDNQTGVHTRSLHRLLRAGTSVEVFSEDKQKHFSPVPLVALLLSDTHPEQWLVDSSF